MALRITRPRLLPLCLLGLSVLVVPRPAAAQSLCQATESVNDCLLRLTAELSRNRRSFITSIIASVRFKPWRNYAIVRLRRAYKRG